MVILRASDFFAGALKATPVGSTIIYHQGNLSRDRHIGPRFLQVNSMAQTAWSLYEQGKVDLFQKRLSPTELAYGARVLPKPHRPVSFVGAYNPDRWSFDNDNGDTRNGETA